MNMLAALYDFLENKTPTPTQDAVFVSKKVKHQWDIMRAINSSLWAESKRDLGVPPPQADPVWFARFGGFYLILDENAEDDEFTLTSCLDQA